MTEMMKIVSISQATGRNPGVEFMVEADRGRALVATGHAQFIREPNAPIEAKPEPAPPMPDIVKEALTLEPWPAKGVRPEKYLLMWPKGKKAALAEAHIKLAKDLKAKALAEAEAKEDPDA